MMSCSLPQEILDLIIDLLCDEPATLKACCLASKALIPRTQSYLFSHVEVNARLTVGSWMDTFRDPSTSPARHTHSLSIRGLPIAIATDGDVGEWIRTFHNVVHLNFEQLTLVHQEVPLTPFYGFSHTVRSLRLTSTSPEVFDLICSFPLLEDLALIYPRSRGAAAWWNAPSTSPKLTGTLELSAVGGIHFATHRLLGFPDGLRFTKVTVSCKGEDSESLTDLVSRCSDTLESLDICCSFTVALLPPIDLSKAMKLRDLTFRCKGATIRWIVSALHTVESQTLHQITIHPYTGTLRYSIYESIHRGWHDLDRLLVRFWTSHSIRPRLVYSPDSGGRDTRDHAPSLLPEMTRRGLVDLVEFSHPS